jgi:hypothetical protein
LGNDILCHAHLPPILIPLTKHNNKIIMKHNQNIFSRIYIPSFFNFNFEEFFSIVHSTCPNVLLTLSNFCLSLSLF